MSVETPVIAGQKPPDTLTGDTPSNPCLPVINPVHEPTTLWIGCSDARVPESVMWRPPPPQVPEQIFVHRNIANQFPTTDTNSVSVLRYGLTGIPNDPVREVRVVGHTSCAGVKAAHGAARGTPIPDVTLARWLEPLTQLARKHPNDSPDQLAVKNVQKQVQNVKEELARLPPNRRVPVNGYLYNVVTGGLEKVAE